MGLIARYRERLPFAPGDPVVSLDLDVAVALDQLDFAETVFRSNFKVERFEHSLNAFFADCAAKTSCPFRNNGDPRTAFQQIQAKVEQQPLTTNSGRSVGPGEFLLGVIRPLYRQDDWPTLARALAQAQSGRGDTLLLLSDDYTERQSNGTYGNLLSANTGRAAEIQPHQHLIGARSPF